MFFPLNQGFPSIKNGDVPCFFPIKQGFPSIQHGDFPWFFPGFPKFSLVSMVILDFLRDYNRESHLSSYLPRLRRPEDGDQPITTLMLRRLGGNLQIDSRIIYQQVYPTSMLLAYCQMASNLLSKVIYNSMLLMVIYNSRFILLVGFLQDESISNSNHQ